MKKYFILSLSLLSFSIISAQKIEKVNHAMDSINKWTIEANVGQSKGLRPFTNGYFSSNPNKVFGAIKINSYTVGARYMFSPKFGVKVDFSFDKFTNNSGTLSNDFEVNQYRIGVQAVINAARLFGIQQELNRFGLLIHGGFQISQLVPQTGPLKNAQDNDGGLVFGFTPQFRITKKLAVNLDVSMLTNYRQHVTWDGDYSASNNNLSGQMISGTLGLSYSLGSNKIHGDWYNGPDVNELAIRALDKKIGDIETLMNDTDKDGVPDYLDQENNSIAGVAVDTRGKMVDLNRNGVPDELERYINKDIVEKIDTQIEKSNATANADLIKKLINEGYVTSYFDTNKSIPTNVSSQGVDFILTYLRNNPTSSVEVIGHADEIGRTAYNDALANKRAESVKNLLVKAGVDASRVKIISAGEDKSVDKDSKEARRLVRRVTFRVK